MALLGFNSKHILHMWLGTALFHSVILVNEKFECDGGRTGVAVICRISHQAQTSIL